MLNLNHAQLVFFGSTRIIVALGIAHRDGMLQMPEALMKIICNSQPEQFPWQNIRKILLDAGVITIEDEMVSLTEKGIGAATHYLDHVDEVGEMIGQIMVNMADVGDLKMLATWAGEHSAAGPDNTDTELSQRRDDFGTAIMCVVGLHSSKNEETGRCECGTEHFAKNCGSPGRYKRVTEAMVASNMLTIAFDTCSMTVKGEAFGEALKSGTRDLKFAKLCMKELAKNLNSDLPVGFVVVDHDACTASLIPLDKDDDETVVDAEDMLQREPAKSNRVSQYYKNN